MEQSKNIFDTPLLDYEEIGFPMDRWHFLFDPTGSQASAAGSGYAEEGESKVVSVFSLGESSFREGTHAAKESSVSTTIDGSKVNIKSPDSTTQRADTNLRFAQIKKDQCCRNCFC